MQRDLGSYRKSYGKSGLEDSDLATSAMEMFGKWFHELEGSQSPEEPNAMTLATIGPDGFPRCRVVLLKQFSAEGFIFFTNYKSEKGRSIEKEPRVCLSFYWPAQERQVIIKGTAGKVSASVSDAYFSTRPEGSQLGAVVSDQSEIISSRADLEYKLSQLRQEYTGKPIPRPPHWGGYLITPCSLEFWQGRANRLHDRVRYSREKNGRWKIERLAP